MCGTGDDRHVTSQVLRDGTAVYERHAEAVYAHARNRTGRQDVALELTAETFAQALRSARLPRGAGPAGSWLAGITNHLIASYLRKRSVDDAYGILEQPALVAKEDRQTTEWESSLASGF